MGVYFYTKPIQTVQCRIKLFIDDVSVMDNNSSRDGSFNDHRDCPVGSSDNARREYEKTSRVLGVLLFPSCTPENIQLRLNNELISGMNKPLLCALLCFDSNALILRSPRHDAHFDDNYCKRQISPVRCDFTVACKIVPKETREKTTVNSSHFLQKIRYISDILLRVLSGKKFTH